MEMCGKYYIHPMTLSQAKALVNENETLVRVLRNVAKGETVYDGYGPVVAPYEDDYTGFYDLCVIENKEDYTEGDFIWVRNKASY